MGISQCEVLNFLFQISCLELGKGYQLDSLSQVQLVILEDFKHLGLVYQRNVNLNKFKFSSKSLAKVKKVLPN